MASQQELDNAIGAERVAQAALVSAQAAVAVAQAVLDKARLDLEFTKVTSPIEGIAGIPQAQVGDLVGPAQAGQLATVSTLDPMRVYFSLNEQAYLRYMAMFRDEAGVVAYNKSVEHRLVLADGSVYPYAGTFHAIDREVDVRTGTLRLEVLFPNPENLLRPGQFARIRFTEVKKDALLVPQRSVSDLQGSSQVAVVGDDNKVEIRQVKPGDRVGTLWVIDEGLKPGERVVYEGVQKAKQGTVVVPQPAADVAMVLPTPTDTPLPTPADAAQPSSATLANSQAR